MTSLKYTFDDISETIKDIIGSNESINMLFYILYFAFASFTYLTYVDVETEYVSKTILDYHYSFSDSGEVEYYFNLYDPMEEDPEDMYSTIKVSEKEYKNRCDYICYDVSEGIGSFGIICTSLAFFIFPIIIVGVEFNIITE